MGFFLALFLFAALAWAGAEETSVANHQQQQRHHKSTLQCKHDSFKFNMKPTFNTKVIIITKVTLRDSRCEIAHNQDFNEYSVSSNYNDCGTQLAEEPGFIVYKNVARVYYQNMTLQSTVIQRTLSYNIGLECRMKNTAIRTIKGKKEPDDGMVIGPQSVLISDYAKGNGTFSVDFEVFKTSKYLESYGNEEFPINVKIDHRIYFEISLNKNSGLNLNLIPKDCYATRTRSFQAKERYYIIQESCQKDNTYQQHRYTKDVFQFSIQAFTFQDGDNGIYVHCQSYVCQNTTDLGCRFGCNKDSAMRKMGKRSVEIVETSNVEGVMISSLEIKINEPQKEAKISDDVNYSLDSNKQGTSANKIIAFIQIPILLAIIIALYLLWSRYNSRRNVRSDKELIYDDSMHIMNEPRIQGVQI